MRGNQKEEESKEIKTNQKSRKRSNSRQRCKNMRELIGIMRHWVNCV